MFIGFKDLSKSVKQQNKTTLPIPEAEVWRWRGGGAKIECMIDDRSKCRWAMCSCQIVENQEEKEEQEQVEGEGVADKKRKNVLLNVNTMK